MTTSQLNELRRLVEEEGHSSASAARQVGVPEQSAYYWLRQMGVKLVKKWGPDQLAQYSAYDRKTDKLMATGSAKEVAAYLEIKEITLRRYVCRGTGKYLIVRVDKERSGDDETT